MYKQTWVVSCKIHASADIMDGGVRYYIQVVPVSERMALSEDRHCTTLHSLSHSVTLKPAPAGQWITDYAVQFCLFTCVEVDHGAAENLQPYGCQRWHKSRRAWEGSNHRESQSERGEGWICQLISISIHSQIHSWLYLTFSEHPLLIQMLGRNSSTQAI